MTPLDELAEYLRARDAKYSQLARHNSTRNYRLAASFSKDASDSARWLTALDEVRTYQQAAQLDVAQDDLAAMLRAVGLSDAARPYSAHEVVQRELLPRLHALLAVEQAAPRSPPREPTSEMLEAAEEFSYRNPPCDKAGMWRAMYDAAPVEQAPQASAGDGLRPPSNDVLKRQIENDPDDEPSAGDYECTR